jgi:hypothetical protein
MIPYEELDRALQRWKARAQSGAGAVAAPELEVSAASVMVSASAEIEFEGAVPEGIEGLPPPPDRTGEIDLGDAVVETYDEEA